jgi:hypothetical protein
MSDSTTTQFYPYDDNFIISSQPTPDEIRGLAGKYKSVVNLRGPNEPGVLLGMLSLNQMMHCTFVYLIV